MRPLYLVVSMLHLSAGSLVAQAIDTSRQKDGTIQKIYRGAVKCLDWYDIPVVAADVADLVFVPGNSANKPISFPATAFDRDFQPHIGVRGSQTFVGQIGDAGLAALYGVRLLVNVGADVAGRNITSEDYHRTFWFYKSLVYTYTLAALTKDLVDRARPDGSDNQSFFSGHSSTAFCAASYLSLELNDWYDRWESTRSDRDLRSTLTIGSDIALYAGATYVAYSRMHDEKHYFSDVAIGAVVGTVVGNLMYRWHWQTDGSPQVNVSFFVIRDTPTMYCSLKF